VTASATQSRARAIRAHRTLENAMAAGALPPVVDVTTAEALILGLLRLGVTKYLAILRPRSSRRSARAPCRRWPDL